MTRHYLLKLLNPRGGATKTPILEPPLNYQITVQQFDINKYLCTHFYPVTHSFFIFLLEKNSKSENNINNNNNKELTKKINGCKSIFTIASDPQESSTLNPLAS